jgi:hypothetical protein
MIWVSICYVAHVNECIATHDTFQNIVATIVLENGAHIQKNFSNLFSHHTRKQMDIIITKDHFWILEDIIIADPTCINLVQCTLSTTIDVQNNTWSYTKWTLGDDFIPLVRKTYGCFHLNFDSFFISCVHVNITHHQQTSLVPSMFIYYLLTSVDYLPTCTSHHDSLAGCHS